jgi:hypothetical protein
MLKEYSDLDKIYMSLMMNQSEYKYYSIYPEKIKKYRDNNFYYNMNYPFSNVNPMFYNKNKKSIWINKIKKMYYYKSINYDKYWYSI